MSRPRRAALRSDDFGLLDGVEIDGVGVPQDGEDYGGDHLENGDGDEQGQGPVAASGGEEVSGEEGGEGGGDGGEGVGHAEHDGRVLDGEVGVAAEQSGSHPGAESEADRQERDDERDSALGDRLRGGGVDHVRDAGERHRPASEAQRLRQLAHVGARHAALLQLVGGGRNDQRHGDGGQVRQDGQEGGFGECHVEGAGQKGREPCEQAVGKVVPGEVRSHQRPERLVGEKCAPRNGVSFDSRCLPCLLHGELLRGGDGIGGLVVHVAQEPPGPPDESEDAEEVKDGGPSTEKEDDGWGDDEAREGSDVQASEGGGDRLGALGAGDTLGEDAGGGGGRDALAEADEEARHEQGGEGEVGARRGDEGSEGPQHDAREEHDLAAVLGREVAAGHLREGIAPEERGLHQALLDRSPAERRRHRHDRHRHVHLVQITQHERAEEREDHRPALLLTLLTHVEAHFLCDEVHGPGAAPRGNHHRSAAHSLGGEHAGARAHGEALARAQKARPLLRPDG
mmetsp:Transcript_10350/g.25441  ORF Transcript_10350/g.25441 Transcript_10350/m.25441 type:complete len:512 (-) Transcript_10350:235-1770(-)